MLTVTFFHADRKVGAYTVPGLFTSVEDRPMAPGKRGLYARHTRGEDLLAVRGTRTLHAWEVVVEPLRGTWDLRIEAER